MICQGLTAISRKNNKVAFSVNNYKIEQNI